MVKMIYLDAFEMYRTNPPIIAPENKNRKKGVIYHVWAPTIEDGFKYLSTNQNLKFLNLYRYFIPKRWQVTLYGKGNQIFKFDQDGEITALLQKYSNSSNLKNINGVTSYLPTVTARPLKGMNVLAEQNYVFESVLNNEKDRRALGVKARDVMKALEKEYAQYAIGNSILGQEYTQEIIFIPIELWFDDSVFTTPEKIIRPVTKSFMGWMLNQLMDINTLRKFPTIALVYNRMILILDANKIPEGTKDVGDLIRDSILNFMKRAKNLKVDKTEDSGDKAEVTLAVAEQKTKDDETVDKVIKSISIDPDKIDDNTKDKLKQNIQKTEKEHRARTPSNTNMPQSDIPDPALSPNEINPDTQVTQSEMDMIVKAKLEGTSIQSQKRNEMLKEKYKGLKIGSMPLAQVAESEKKYKIEPLTVKADTINEDLKKLTSHEMEKSYNDNLAQYDLANILLHFSKIQPPLYLNKDIKVEDASTPTERVVKYSVEFEDANRKRHRFSFLMPKLYREKYLYLNDQEMNLSHQKFPYPVTKVSPTECQLVTNYNKIFTERYGTNLSPRSTKIKKVLGGAECPRCVKVERGDATILNKNYLTTVEYDDIGSVAIKITILNQKNAQTTTFYLIANEGSAVISGNAPIKVQQITYDDNGTASTTEIEDTTLIPIGITKTVGSQPKILSQYYISGRSNIVYDQNGEPKGELSEFIINTIIEADDKAEDVFKDTTTGTKFIYARSRIMNEWIPTIIVLGAADPNGLIGVLEKGKVKYQFLEKRPNVDKDSTGIIPFSDGYLVYDRYPYENSLLMNGLLTVPTRELSFYEMGSRDVYVDLFDLLVGRRNLIDAMHNFYYLMIDPITKDVCDRLGMPTDFTTLMLYCIGTLADNTFQIDSSYLNTRVRSNEIINVYLYKELATAWERWSSGREDKFSIWERAVIQDLLTVQIVDPHSTLNVTLEAENDNLIKLKGPSGMNEDHSYTLEKRAYHPTMKGVIAMNSTPSGEVGIGRHLTLNANIDDARGFITINKNEEYDGTELLSVGEMLQTFGPESADIERVAMAMNQSKHLVPVSSQSSGLVSYDMERVIPYISNDFAFRAKKDGKVIEIKDSIMIIQYSDGTYDDIDLSEHPDKNVDGGFYIMNQLSTKMKVGQKFKENDILAYNEKYINNNDMFGDPCADVGCLARVVVESNGGVYEDSDYITDAFAHRMSTKITRQKRVILSRFANIKYIAKIGQQLKANDPILTFDDTEDEFSSQLLQSIAEEEGDEDEIIATGAPVISKTDGVIKDIYIYYTIPLEEMTPSMRKVVEAYDKQAKTRSRTLSKYINPTDANTKIKPAEQLIPDSQGKVKGVSVGDGVIIDFYIEYLDIMAPGDKSTKFSPLKATCSFVIPQGLEPYTDFNPERKIDTSLACVGVYKRMCLDFVKVGGMTKFLVEMKRIHKNKYGEKIKEELKKLK